MNAQQIGPVVLWVALVGMLGWNSVRIAQEPTPRTLLVVNATPDTLRLYVAGDTVPVLYADADPGQALCLDVPLDRLAVAPFLYAEVGAHASLSPPLVGGLVQGDPSAGTAREVNLVTDHAEWAFYPDRNDWTARWAPCER